MVPAPCEGTAPVPPPAYHRTQRKRRPALHLDALTLVTRLHLLALCRLAVQLAPARSRCGGRPRPPPPCSPPPVGLPRPHAAVSRLGLAAPLLPRPRQWP